MNTPLSLLVLLIVGIILIAGNVSAIWEPSRHEQAVKVTFATSPAIPAAPVVDEPLFPGLPTR